MLALSLFAAALTLPLHWTVPILCANSLTLDVPPDASPGDKVLITLTTDVPMPLRYAIYDGDTIISDWQTTKGNITFKPSAKLAGKTLTIDAIAEREGCDQLRQSAQITIAGIDLSAPLEPVNVVPWALAGIGVLIAAVLIWKR
jgi:hypothetical protein